MTVLPVHVRFIKTREDAKLPTKAHEGDAGFDLYAVERVILHPLRPTLVSTGLKIALPEGYEAQVRPRSGLAKQGVTVINSPGTVDAGYRGDLGVLLVWLHAPDKSEYRVMPGNRIAQLVIQPVLDNARCVEVDAFDETARGENGFGSTGL